MSVLNVKPDIKYIVLYRVLRHIEWTVILPDSLHRFLTWISAYLRRSSLFSFYKLCFTLQEIILNMIWLNEKLNGTKYFVSSHLVTVVLEVRQSIVQTFIEQSVLNHHIKMRAIPLKVERILRLMNGTPLTMLLLLFPTSLTCLMKFQLNSSWKQVNRKISLLLKNAVMHMITLWIAHTSNDGV